MDELDKIELTEEIKLKLREEQTRLIKIIEAFAKLEESKEWRVVKELVFEKSLNAIERQIMNECLVPIIVTDKLYRLQGEWAWAKQYNEIGRFVENLKKQLEAIKKRLS